MNEIIPDGFVRYLRRPGDQFAVWSLFVDDLATATVYTRAGVGREAAWRIFRDRHPDVTIPATEKENTMSAKNISIKKAPGPGHGGYRVNKAAHVTSWTGAEAADLAKVWPTDKIAKDALRKAIDAGLVTETGTYVVTIVWGDNSHGVFFFRVRKSEFTVEDY